MSKIIPVRRRNRRIPSSLAVLKKRGKKEKSGSGTGERRRDSSPKKLKIRPK